MKRLAKEMVNAWYCMVMDELWLMNAIGNYCHNHDISLNEEEESELIEMLMNGDY